MWSEIVHFSVGGAQLISGVVLIYALVVIAIELKNNDTGDQVNQFMLLVHAVAFIAYNVVIIIYYVFNLRYYLASADPGPDDQKLRQMYIAWVICEAVNFLAQVFLIVILWQLATKVEFLPEDEESQEDVNYEGKPEEQRRLSGEMRTERSESEGTISSDDQTISEGSVDIDAELRKTFEKYKKVK